MADARQVAAESTEAFNAHDESRMRELYSQDAVFEAPGDVRLQGRDATVGYAMAWLNAFPDARLQIHSELEAGDWMTQEFTFEGTHDDTLTGPAGSIPATHRRLAGRGVQIFKVQDGKIVEEHLYFDQVQVLTQLGLMPEPATAQA
jgi:steroid delta-isomerase-like uncharacterized protein